MRRFRRLNHLWANLCGFFWLPCPRCGEMFGGHEINPNAAERIGDKVKVCCWRHPDDPWPYPETPSAVRPPRLHSAQHH